MEDVEEFRLLKREKAARVLGISPRKLWELANRGEIPSVKCDRLVRFDPRDLMAWIDQNKAYG